MNEQYDRNFKFVTDNWEQGKMELTRYEDTYIATRCTDVLGEFVFRVKLNNQLFYRIVIDARMAKRVNKNGIEKYTA